MLRRRNPEHPNVVRRINQAIDRDWVEDLLAEIRDLPEVWFGIPDDEFCN